MQKKKSSELPKRRGGQWGSEDWTTVNMDENITDEFEVSLKNAEECVESTISQSIVVKRKLSQSLIGWCKRHRDTEMRMRPTANESKYEAEDGLQKFRVTVRAATDTGEDMVCILITNDSQTKLNVVRQLEPWSSIALTSFLWMESRTRWCCLVPEFVMQWAYSPSRIGVCVWTNDCVRDGHSCGRRQCGVAEHMDYSCDFHFRIPDGRSEQGEVCENIHDCGTDACRNANCVDEVNGYTCDCDENFELVLQVNGSVCVAKECEMFSRTRFSGTDVNVNVKGVIMPWQLWEDDISDWRVHECRARECDVTGAIQVAWTPRHVCSVEECVGE